MKTLILLSVCLLTLACKKLIDVDTPKTQLTIDKIFSDTTSTKAALVNIYALFEKSIEQNYTRNIGLYTDELNFTAAATQQTEFWQSNVSPGNSSNLNVWKNLYLVIYQCNDIVEKVKLNSDFPASSVQRFTSEARFLRAYAYFYLTNLYGKVPLILNTNVNDTRLAVQSDSIAIYKQIVADLSDAKQGLSFVTSSSSKVRADQWAATALLAKIYLIQKNWQLAEKEATAVILSGKFTPLNAVQDVFKANSRESILQFWTQTGFVTSATSLIPTSNTVLPQAPVTKVLYNLFLDGDLRKSNWFGTSVATVSGVATTYHFAYKYKNRAANSSNPEYLVALRIAEQFLIRAEAKVNLGDILGAREDLNVIRKRAGLNDVTTEIPIDLLTAIAQERRKELFMEWGNRFIDLKTSGQLNSVMTNYKTTWLPRAVLLPIPQNELVFNTRLVQNPDYN